MKKICILLVILLVISACKKKEAPVVFEKYDETEEISQQQDHKIDRMKFKLIQSNYLDMNEVFKPFENDLAYFSESDYEAIKPYVLEKSIPEIQEAVANKILSYEQITLFYLYRIRKFESNHDLFINGIISLNPNAVKQAKEYDKKNKEHSKFSLYGLPILLKDNINTSEMPTTAGAVAMLNNQTQNAFIVNQLIKNDAIILGKANLSEWAYFFCSGCPVGYSAVGGQTLNPYGRKVFETGGSSSGSGVSVAANYAVAAVGSETSGSILSPSSKNAVVGLKPTIGLLSRAGIVPISSTLDTSGPMTKNVIDNAILLNALIGFDEKDNAMIPETEVIDYTQNIEKSTVKGKRFGAQKQFLSDSLYNNAVQVLKQNGAEIVEIELEEANFSGFLTLLNIDMKNDLPNYFKNYGGDLSVSSVKDIIEFNRTDTLKMAPYGQQLFEGIVADTTSNERFEEIKKRLYTSGSSVLKKQMDSLNLDAILSINNYNAGLAAVAKYPCLIVPMGYNKGEPFGLTFIAKPFEEKKLLELGYAYEKISNKRKLPSAYK
jgi:amidase